MAETIGPFFPSLRVSIGETRRVAAGLATAVLAQPPREDDQATAASCAKRASSGQTPLAGTAAL